VSFCQIFIFLLQLLNSINYNSLEVILTVVRLSSSLRKQKESVPNIFLPFFIMYSMASRYRLTRLSALALNPVKLISKEQKMNVFFNALRNLL
jgi:hypothetical protein